jgi:hypothetical protein
MEIVFNPRKILSMIMSFLFIIPQFIPLVSAQSYATEQCSQEGVSDWANAPFELQYIPEGVSTTTQFNLVNSAKNLALTGGLGFASTTVACVVFSGGLCVIPALLIGGVTAVGSLIVGYWRPTSSKQTTVQFNGENYTAEQLESVNFSQITALVPDRISCGWHWACSMGIPDPVYTKTNTPVWTNTPVLHYGFISVKDQYNNARQGWVVPADEFGFRDPSGIAVTDSFKVFEEQRDLGGNLVGRQALPFDLELVRDNGNSTFTNEANLYFTLSEQSLFSQTSYLVEYGLDKDDPYGLIDPQHHGFNLTAGATWNRNNTLMNPALNSTPDTYFFLDLHAHASTPIGFNFNIVDSNNASYSEGFEIIGQPSGDWIGYKKLTKVWGGRTVNVSAQLGSIFNVERVKFNIGLDPQDYVRLYDYNSCLYTYKNYYWLENYNDNNKYIDVEMSKEKYYPDPSRKALYVGNDTYIGYGFCWMELPEVARCPDNTCTANVNYIADWIQASNEGNSYGTRTLYDGKRVSVETIQKTDGNVTKSVLLWKGQNYFDIVIDQNDENVTWDLVSPYFYDLGTHVNYTNPYNHEISGKRITSITGADNNYRYVILPTNYTNGITMSRYTIRFYIFPTSLNQAQIDQKIYMDFAQPTYFLSCGTTQTQYLELTNIDILNIVSENNTVNMTEFKDYDPFRDFVTTTTIPSGYQPPYNYSIDWFKPLFNISGMTGAFGFVAPFISPFFIATLMMIFLSALAGAGFGMVEGSTFDGRAFGITMLLLTLIYTIIGIYPSWLGITFIILAGFLVARSVVMALGG